MTKRVQFVDVVRDEGLRKQEGEATAAFRRFFPKAPRLRLYRTADGRVGFQAQIALSAGDRVRLADAYAAVMRVLGERRGRPAREPKVQAKLRLTANVYKALKKAAKAEHTTVSGLVEDLAHRAQIV